ncbi:accessory factor UbiK family protein [Sphingomonas jatrophae]|uniref:BMFP domain-containing protein YqiC n=1 Tax=Sphingomonas jatrophae TaxID=1166337 RepID=A0A1I6M8W6_9SPHN|nr:accessory factor UbiK family protein [Sphingomonas jatrophae]SFS12063.1 BMFP domain-containing protein YqiC [Sphingomonas jatrophae]
MQTENRFFDDLAKVLNGAAGTLAGMGREAESTMRARAREWVGGLDLVSREEFDAVKAMAATARDEVEALRARLDALEGKGEPPVPNSYTVSPDAGGTTGATSDRLPGEPPVV